MKKRKFRLFDAVLATVCIILVGDAIAPTASIGNSQFVWWILMIIGFCLPYGLISAELGSQYPSEGGMYDWIKRAFNKKWASRVAWYYWINFPLWVASLATLTTDILMQMFDVNITWWGLILIQLFYIWLVTVLGFFRISQNKWVVNIGAICKVLFMVALGGLGIYVAVTQGAANELTPSSLVPLLGEGGKLDLLGIGFVSVIIFNFLGFEVIATFSEDMKNPRKEIPKAVILGGLLIALFYILPSFGIGVAIPTQEISTSTGLLDAFVILLKSIGITAGAIKGIIVAVGGMFLYTLIANITSWQFGVNAVAAYSANDGGLPKLFGKTNKHGVPYVAAIITGVVASIIAIAGIWVGETYPDLPAITDLFWTFFSLSLVTLLISYMPMFLAFLKLRQTSTPSKNGYFIRGGRFTLSVMALVPFVLLVLGAIFTILPIEEFSARGFRDMWDANWPMIAGLAIAVVIGEIVAWNTTRHPDKEPKHVEA